MLDLETTLSVPQSVAFQSLGDGGQTVLVSMETGYLFTCNQTTRAFLDAVDGKRTVGQIVDLLGEQFDVELAKLRADMLALAQKLESEGLLVASDGDAAA